MSVSRCTCGVKIGRAEISPIAKCFYYKPSKESSVQNRAVYSLKHTDDKRIAEFLCAELVDSVGEMLKSEGIQPYECIFTYVPRRGAAIHKNGFDQGRRLAYYTALGFGKKNFRRLIFRVGGREQKKLDSSGRQKNLGGAIRLGCFAKGRISGKVVCVVDDVVTSGATMAAAEKILLAGGAKRVVFACVARTKSDK